MASPSVAATAEGAVTTAGTTHTITFPSGSVAGDLIVVIFAGAVASPSAWSDSFSSDVASSRRVAWKQIDGTEGGNVAPTITSTKSSWIVYRITGAADPATQAPEVAIAAGASGLNPDPPAATMTGGPKDFLVIAALDYAGQEEADDDTWCNSAPTNYGTLLQKTSGTGGAATTNSYVASAHRALTAASSEDPGTFNVDQNVATLAARTITIHPSGAQTVTHVVLTTTPTFPAARVDHSLTHQVLTVTPSLPAASVAHSLTHVVLTVTPSLPVAQVGPIIRVQQKANSVASDTGIAVTLDAAPVEGRLIVVRLGTGVTGRTWSMVGSGWQTAYNTSRVAQFYKVAGAGEDVSIAATQDGAAAALQMVVDEYAGLANTAGAAFGGSANNGPFTGTTGSTGTVGAVATADALALANWNFGGTHGAISGFTNGFLEDDPSVTDDARIVARLIRTSAGSTETTATWTTSRTGHAGIAVYKQAVGDQSVTHVVLSTTPSLPVASVNHALTHQVLTTTPTLPAASITHSLTHVVLTTTPSLPAAAIAQAITHQALTATPTLPPATITHAITHVVLSTTPSLPAATVAESQTVTHVVLTVTPTFGAPTYEQVVSADAPVAWWKLDDASGDAEDYGSGTDADMVTHGSPVYGETSLVAGGGASVKFDSTGTDYFDTASASKLQIVGSLSFECWFRYTGSPGSLGTIMSERFGDGDVRYMLGFYDGSSNTLKPNFGFYNGIWEQARAAGALSPNTTYHLVGVYDASIPELRLYVNAVQDGSDTVFTFGQPTGTAAIQLGRRWDNSSNEYLGQTADCWLQHAAFYDYALTLEQIEAHYEAGISGGGTASVNHALTHQVLTVTPSLPAATIQSAQSVTHTVLTISPSLPAATVTAERTATHIVLTVTPSLPAASIAHSITHIVLTVTPSLPPATVTAERTASHVVLTITPSLPPASLTHSLTHTVLTVTPSLPAATVTAQRTATHVVLTISPSLPAAAVAHAITHNVLSVTPTLPPATVTTVQSVTHIVLTVTPSLPASNVLQAFDLVHQTLTVTPSLPQATVQVNSIAHIVLTVTPTYPQASVNHAITHTALTVTPTLPAATVTAERTATHVVLTIVPTYPVASIAHSITHAALSVTPTLPPATVTAERTASHVVLTITPSLPAASVTHQLAHTALTVTPSLPPATVTAARTATHVVLTITPTFPPASLAHAITHTVLTISPSLPPATTFSDRSITHVVLSTTPSLPPATLNTANNLVHATLTVTPSLPAASVNHALTHVVLSATPSLPPATLRTSMAHVALTITPSLPPAALAVSVLHQLLTATPALPAATVIADRTALHVTLTITPTFPPASVGGNIGHVVLTISPSLPAASISRAIAHTVLAATPTFPQAAIQAEREALHTVLVVTPTLPKAVVFRASLHIPVDGSITETGELVGSISGTGMSGSITPTYSGPVSGTVE